MNTSYFVAPFLQLALICSSLPTVAAANITKTIVLLEKEDRETPAQAVLVSIQQGTPTKITTGLDGRAVFTLPICDSSVLIRIESRQFYKEVSVTCDPDAAEQVIYLEDNLQYYAQAAARGFTRSASANFVTANDNRNWASVYKDALSDQNWGLASKAAGNMAHLNRQREGGLSLSAASIEMGMIALGVNPYADSAQILADNEGTGTPVLTDLGRDFALRWQAQNGIGAAGGAWNGRAQNFVARLPESPAQIVSPASPEDLLNFTLDATGRPVFGNVAETIPLDNLGVGAFR